MVIESAMSGPKAAYGPEKPDSSPIFRLPLLAAPALVAGAVVAAPLAAGALAAGAAGLAGALGEHAARTEAAVTAPAPPSAARKSVRLESRVAWSCNMPVSPYELGLDPTPPSRLFPRGGPFRIRCPRGDPLRSVAPERALSDRALRETYARRGPRWGNTRRRVPRA